MGRKPKLFRKPAVNLTIDPTVRALGDELAQSQNVSLSELVERLLREFVAKQGKRK